MKLLLKIFPMFHSISSEILIWFGLSSQKLISRRISLLMFLLGAFLSGPKVPKGTKSSYWALKFLLGPEVPIGLTLWWKWTSLIFKVKRFILTKKFYQKVWYRCSIWSAKKQIVLNVLSIFNNYFSKNILAGAPNRNKKAQ